MAFNNPPPRSFPHFSPFFGNIQHDVRCEEGYEADPGQQDKTYNPGKNEARCCQNKHATDKLQESLHKGMSRSLNGDHVEQTTGRIPRNRRVTGFDVEGIDVGRSPQVGVLGGGFPTQTVVARFLCHFQVWQVW